VRSRQENDRSTDVRFRGASGIRAAVRRRELLPDGAGPAACTCSRKDTLDRFVRARAQSLGRLVSRPVPGVDHGKEDATSRQHGTGEEPIRVPGAGYLPAYRASKRRCDAKRSARCGRRARRSLPCAAHHHARGGGPVPVGQSLRWRGSAVGELAAGAPPDSRAEVTRAIIGHTTERMTHRGKRGGDSQQARSAPRPESKKPCLSAGVDPGGATRI
jgi:hypothetical protein